MNNDKFQFNGPITKREFIKKITEIANGRELSARQIYEQGQRLTLLYINDAHAGTWKNKTGVIFSNERIEKYIADMEMIKRDLGEI